ncbi:MAG: PEP-utilizing enzyme [Eggerthellaceae bacterium]|nr:PEP-utilizing enzyme [Eggerthellaceae bacterium]
MKLTVLDNSNIVESYPGITLPLTYSFVRIAYRGVFKGVIGSNLKNDRILAEFADVFDNMIASYQGRVYYCINNWYSLIDFMPFAKRITPVWQDMMGVESKEIYLNPPYHFSFWQKARLYGNLFGAFLHVQREMWRLEGSFHEVEAYFNETYSDSLSIEDLLALFHGIEQRVLQKWYVTIYNDLYAFIWTGLLKRQLKKKGANVAAYISGITSLESLKPVRALLRLAKEYGKADDILDEPAVKEYLRVYGDRSPCELKLEVMTYRENPQLLEQKIREYASDGARLDEMIQGLEGEGEPKKRPTYTARKAQAGIKSREVSRLNRSRIYGMVRRIFLQVGKLLYEAGYVEDGLDMFYLEIDEIEGGQYGSFREKVAERKAVFAHYALLAAPARLVFDGDTLIDEKAVTPWTGELAGIGTSIGCVTAKAIVLESPDEKVDVKGKVIVTKTTDPGWAFLLTMASGIVAEKGSLLSHTAIISRELRIPAVVAVEDATRIIKTGDLLEVDGNAGSVKIVSAH